MQKHCKVNCPELSTHICQFGLLMARNVNIRVGLSVDTTFDVPYMIQPKMVGLSQVGMPILTNAH